MGDIAIATAAARTVIDAEITAYVPPMFQGRIPPLTWPGRVTGRAFS